MRLYSAIVASLYRYSASRQRHAARALRRREALARGLCFRSATDARN